MWKKVLKNRNVIKYSFINYIFVLFRLKSAIFVFHIFYHISVAGRQSVHWIIHLKKYAENIKIIKLIKLKIKFNLLHLKYQWSFEEALCDVSQEVFLQLEAHCCWFLKQIFEWILKFELNSWEKFHWKCRMKLMKAKLLRMSFSSR